MFIMRKRAILNNKMLKIKCFYCCKTFEYESIDNTSVNELPDGYLKYGEWYCAKCGDME